MVKEKYLRTLFCFILITFCLSTDNILASPWLPEEGKFQYIIDFHTADTFSTKKSNINSEQYYLLEREIYEGTVAG